MSTNIGLAVQERPETKTINNLPLLPTIPDLARGVEIGSEQNHITPQEELEEIRLSRLFDYYQEHIASRIKYYHLYSDRHKRKESLERKTCDKECNRVPYSYQDCLIIRHSSEAPFQTFAQKLMDHDYRYCKYCKRIMPLSKTARSKTCYQSITPAPLCPCCKERLVYVSVLVRKTKMKKALFKHEGY